MRKLKRTLAAFACLMSIALSLEAAWTTKRLTHNDGSSWFTSIASSGGNVYVTWMDQTPGNYEIYFRRSLDGGATWEMAKRLSSTAGFSAEPTIAVSGAYVYVTWHDFTPGNADIFFRRSTDYGATWDGKKRLTNNAGDSMRPRVAASGANVYMTWEDVTPGNSETYFRRSTDNGSTWKSAKRITNTAENSVYQDIAVDGGDVYLVWNEGESGSYQIYFCRSSNWGAAWDEAQPLTLGAYDYDFPRIAVSGSAVYLVFRSNCEGEYNLFFTKSEDSGGSWESLKQLTFNSGYSYVSGIAAENAKVYLAFFNMTAGDNDVYCRKSADGGDTWNASQRLTNNAGGSANPRVCLGAANVYVVYYDDTPGNKEIFVKFKSH